MILKGYQLNATSWENDADCYNTKTMHGLTLEEVKFHLALLNTFGSRYGGGGFGGDCPSTEEYTEVLLPIIKAHPCAASYLEDEYAVDMVLENIIFEYIGYSYEGSDCSRVFESASVYYFENDVQEVVL